MSSFSSLLPTPYSLLPKTQDFVPNRIDNCYKCILADQVRPRGAQSL
ncbi:hypothetical protein [Moorena producens]|nr:hypothetical protein [Moorena producens]